MCIHFLVLNRIVSQVASSLLLAVLAVPSCAQEVLTSNAGRGLAPVYDVAHEIILAGTIQQVVTRNQNGPAGLHLLIAGPLGKFDAHLGPYMPQHIREALRAGDEVQITGAMETVHGRQVLLARQILFDGRTVIIRNTRGFLVQPSDAVAGREKTNNTAAKGGIQ